MPDDDQQQQQTPPINLSDPAALTAAYQKYLEYLQQVGNQRPAQAPVISQAQLDANRPTSLLGQLGEALGGGAPSDVPMTSDQRERAGLRGLFNFSRGLLGTGTFDSIGQALDRGLTEAERGQYNQEAQVAYGQSAAQDWQRQQMADRLAALKESIPLLQGIQRLNMPSLYGPGGGPGAQAGNTPGTVPGAPVTPGSIGSVSQTPGWSLLATQTPEMQAMIQKAAAASGMPVELLAGHKWNESRTASSVPAGDGGASVGIMQMQQGALDAYNKAHNTSYTQQDINKDPQLALNVGSGYWMQLRQQYGSDFLASMAYARGPGATDAWIKNGSKAEDLPDGVRRVLGNVYGPGSFSGANPIPEALKIGGGGKPYQVAGPVVAPPSQQPAQPAANPPAASGGGSAAALPTPPQPPPGAVPTVTTPEEAAATARAAGTPVQVPGTQALWAKPEGGVTSTPRLIMPGTETASLAPLAPPGAIPPVPAPATSTSPAQPAPQPATQAQQPPSPTPAVTTPTRDTMARNPDGTFVIPDDKVTQPEFIQRNLTPPTELERQQMNLPSTGISAQIMTMQASAAKLRADAIAARRVADTGASSGIQGFDIGAAQKNAAQAEKDAADAEGKVGDLLRGVNQDQAQNFLTWEGKEKDRLATLYNDKVIQPANMAAQQQQASDLRIREKRAETDITGAGQMQTNLDNDAKASYDRIDQLSLLRGLSDNMGTPTLLTSIKAGNMSLADIASGLGLGTKDLQDKVAATQAFRAGVMNAVRALREGGAATGEPRSNQDLQFVMDMLPTATESPQTRTAIVSFLQQVNQRRADFAAKVSELTHTNLSNGQPMPIGQAMAEARKQLGDIVPTLPPDITTADPATQRKMFRDAGIRPYTFFRYPNGNMDLYKGPQP